MHKDDLEWRSGQVAFWDMDWLDPTRSMAAHGDHLKEDLALVEYPNHVCLDVGWYRGGLEDGFFGVVVIKDGDWEEPVFRGRAEQPSQLASVIAGAVRVAESAARER